MFVSSCRLSNVTRDIPTLELPVASGECSIGKKAVVPLVSGNIFFAMLCNYHKSNSTERI